MLVFVSFGVLEVCMDVVSHVLLFSRCRRSSAGLLGLSPACLRGVIICGHVKERHTARHWPHHPGPWGLKVCTDTIFHAYIIVLMNEVLSVMAIGAATISDIYRLEERGTAMGVFFGVSHLFLFSV